MTKRVVVGMSGGIDSSVTAAILKENGYEVYGVTLKLWEENGSVDRRWEERSCCKIGLARYVSDRLKINYQVVDIRDKFKKDIVDDFCKEYLLGRTPNPCIRCNERVKFDHLLEISKDIGADYLATGHYAKIEYDKENGKYYLKKGEDQTKDQSYFLYRIKEKNLPNILLPLGNIKKEEVWKRVSSLGMPVDEVKESQEICFVTQNDYRIFLKNNYSVPIVKGNIISTDGKILGKHEGVPYYTIGQRRGLGIPFSHRLYVIRLDVKNNLVVVGPEEELYKNSFTISDLNILDKDLLNDGMRVSVKIRYRTKESFAKIFFLNENCIKVIFEEKQKGITPGQSAVFYKDDLLLGGGIIDSV